MLELDRLDVTLPAWKERGDSCAAQKERCGSCAARKEHLWKGPLGQLSDKNGTVGAETGAPGPWSAREAEWRLGNGGTLRTAHSDGPLRPHTSSTAAVVWGQGLVGGPSMPSPVPL
eukprot:gene7127-biopygen3251